MRPTAPCDVGSLAILNGRCGGNDVRSEVGAASAPATPSDRVGAFAFSDVDTEGRRSGVEEEAALAIDGARCVVRDDDDDRGCGRCGLCDSRGRNPSETAIAAKSKSESPSSITVSLSRPCTDILLEVLVDALRSKSDAVDFPRCMAAIVFVGTLD